MSKYHNALGKLAGNLTGICDVCHGYGNLSDAGICIACCNKRDLCSQCGKNRPNPNIDTLHKTIMCAECSDRMVPHDEGPYPYSELKKPRWRKQRKLYHGTCDRIAGRIEAEGVYRKGVFFAIDFDHAAEYATGEAGGWGGGHDCGAEECNPVVTSAIVRPEQVGLCAVEGNPVSKLTIPLVDFRIEYIDLDEYWNETV